MTESFGKEDWNLEHSTSHSGHTDKEEAKKPSIHDIERYHKQIVRIKEEISKVIIGQERIIDRLIMALLCDGHVLIEGVPGIAKTLAIKALSQVIGGDSERIQFTVDLLPTDIVGITTYTPGKGFEVIKGPIFAHFVIADEINRSPPKTQSALIEAMQEKQVTIGKQTFKLPLPFFVMANQNPLEQSGVYTLPEAQVDRFIFKVLMGYPSYEEEERIIQENVSLKKFEEFGVRPIITPREILLMQGITKKIYLSPKVKKYIVDIVRKTRDKDFSFSKHIEWGCSPRAGIALFIASKANAFMKGRNFVIPEDVDEVAHDVMRHRLILSYRARAEGITSDKIIDSLLGKEVSP